MYNFSIKLYETCILYSKGLAANNQAAMMGQKDKLSKLEKRMTEKSGVICRKKSKITDFFKKRGKFVTLNVPKAVQVNPMEHIGQPNNDQDVGDVVYNILLQDVFIEPYANDYVPSAPLEGFPENEFSMHDIDNEMKCRRCLIVPDNQLCPFS